MGTMSPDILSEIKKAVVQGNDDTALDLISQALATNISPFEEMEAYTEVRCGAALYYILASISLSVFMPP